ncbi:GNAT family N-acetyltransferase [Mucilaginibacter roseus]|uniref:GNAT family N-acetyltransferase n=1 Tax=Mucilaginibacter roseus TaxID=1528868 RepID=A0ABS8U6A6_9SPHI|nr:GNAT family N-acetyltransferase [Mucilaginibacter roseus]MCD8741600.1 GNAT family N-acetyltransferase [Mucilaginibacter roseus]
MINVLENPAWHALLTGNAPLAIGSERVKFFDEEVSPFVGLVSNTTDNFTELADLLPHERVCVFIDPAQISVPAPWQVLNCVECYQMVFSGKAVKISAGEVAVVDLTDEHIPQMLALTQATNPGPFSQQTIRFGHYKGIFDGDKLVAMAGQRLTPSPYAELSAVCTHPDYLGRSYAKLLLMSQIERLLKSGGVPYLHVRHDNERAIGVYKSLGFTATRKLFFHVIKKAKT